METRFYPTVSARSRAVEGHLPGDRVVLRTSWDLGLWEGSGSGLMRETRVSLRVAEQNYGDRDWLRTHLYGGLKVGLVWWGP